MERLAGEELGAGLGRGRVVAEPAALREVALDARDELREEVLDLGVRRGSELDEARRLVAVVLPVAARHEEALGNEDVQVIGELGSKS